MMHAIKKTFPFFKNSEYSKVSEDALNSNKGCNLLVWCSRMSGTDLESPSYTRWMLLKNKALNFNKNIKIFLI